MQRTLPHGHVAAVLVALRGSSANPGWRDFAVAAEIVRGKTVPPNVSFDVGGGDGIWECRSRGAPAIGAAC